MSKLSMSHVPPQWNSRVAYAIKALASGTANDAQQKLAVDYIINDLCNTYDLSYRPGQDGDRQTTFAEGRRFVGLQLVKLINLDNSLIHKEK